MEHFKKKEKVTLTDKKRAAKKKRKESVCLGGFLGSHSSDAVSASGLGSFNGSHSSHTASASTKSSAASSSATTTNTLKLTNVSDTTVTTASTSTTKSTSAAHASSPSSYSSSLKPGSLQRKNRASAWRELFCCWRCVNSGDQILKIKQVTSKAELDEILSRGKLIVVNFGLTWCGPCKIISPQLEALAKDHPDVVFIKIDVDESEDITEEYKITAVPTTILFKKGEEVGKVVGASIDKIKEQLLKNL